MDSNNIILVINVQDCRVEGFYSGMKLCKTALGNRVRHGPYRSSNEDHDNGRPTSALI